MHIIVLTFPAHCAGFVDIDVDQNSVLGALVAAVVGDKRQDVIPGHLVVERLGISDHPVAVHGERLVACYLLIIPGCNYRDYPVTEGLSCLGEGLEICERFS